MVKEVLFFSLLGLQIPDYNTIQTQYKQWLISLTLIHSEKIGFLIELNLAKF